MNEFLLPIGIISLLIIINGLFVAAEFSIVAAPRTRIAQKAEAGSGSARHIFAILNDPAKQNRYLATAQIGVTIASLGLGMYGEHIVADWLLHPLERLGVLAEPLAHSIATILAISLLTYLHVVLGEMIPKSLALQHAESAVLRLEGPMALIGRIFSPIVHILNGAGNLIVRMLGIPPAGASGRLFSAEELEYLVEESTESGLIEPSEQLFIENIFDLGERTVGQVMTPRNHIAGINAISGEANVLTQVCEGRHSRYPIYEHDLDQIMGILHIKDLARRQVHDDLSFDLHSLLRPAVFVPESLSLEQMLIRFRQTRSPIAIVMDEFGGTAGLVTLEDVVEEVVGEILDEFDQELTPLEHIQPGTVRVRGDLLVDELNQLCDLDIDHPEADTVGGLVMALLGRVAQSGDTAEHDGVTFEVETAEGLAIRTLIVQLPQEETPQPDD